MPDLFAAPLPLAIFAFLNFLATFNELTKVLLSLVSARVFGLEADGKEEVPDGGIPHLPPAASLPSSNHGTASTYDVTGVGESLLSDKC